MTVKVFFLTALLLICLFSPFATAGEPDKRSPGAGQNGGEGGSLSPAEQAYELNRQGMVAMSEAKFEEAVLLFRKASEKIPDYGIKGRPLYYTPTFMSSWAFEKMGKNPEACVDFKKFLALVGEKGEESKKEHASVFIRTHCG